MSDQKSWTKKEYEQLAARVDELLAQAKRLKMPMHGVNWGDLHVASIEKIQEVYPYPEDEPVIRVTIEEANSPKLARWVQDQLAPFGYDRVEIVTEW